MRLSHRKKTERREQFLRLAMCGLRECANYRTRIKIRKKGLLGFSPREKRRKLRAAERKRLRTFREVTCLLQLTLSALCVYNRTIKNSKSRAQRAVFAISHVRFARMRELSHGVLKSEKKVCSAFRPAKNDANSAQRKEKNYAVLRKVPCLLC